MDVFGNHALHCAKDIGIKYRHDIARDTVFDICYKANVSARKEASLGLRSDSAKDLKPADILMLNWEGGKDVCFDVTVVSAFTGAGTRRFPPGHTISMAINRKCNKYLEKCSTHDYGFGVLALTTLGELGEDTIAFLASSKCGLLRQRPQPVSQKKLEDPSILKQHYTHQYFHD